MTRVKCASLVVRQQPLLQFAAVVLNGWIGQPLRMRWWRLTAGALTGRGHRRRRCTCSSPLRAVGFGRRQGSYAAQCLTPHTLLETRRSRSCLDICRQFDVFLCHLEKRNLIGARRSPQLCPDYFRWQLTSADVFCSGIAR